MTDLGGSRPTHRPGDNFASLPLRSIKVRGTWTRLFDRHHDPIFFNRRKGNRFTPIDGPYEVLYTADAARTCFLEIFGDELYEGQNRIARSRWQPKEIASLEIPEINVCDLTDSAALAAMGLDKGSLYCNDLSIPQAWSKAIMEHPAAFQGILYLSRFGDGRCLAIFGVPGLAPQIREMERHDLHGSIEGESFAREFNIVLI